MMDQWLCIDGGVSEVEIAASDRKTSRLPAEGGDECFVEGDLQDLLLRPHA